MHPEAAYAYYDDRPGLADHACAGVVPTKKPGRDWAAIIGAALGWLTIFALGYGMLFLAAGV